MKNVYNLLLFAVIFFFSSSNYSLADVANDIDTISNKFDTSISEFSLEKATYLVYFGHDNSNLQVLVSDNSRRKSSEASALLTQHKKLIQSRKERVINVLKGQEFQVIRSYNAVPAIVIRTSTEVIKALAKSPLVQNIGLDNSGGVGHLNEAIPQSNIDLVKAIPLSGEGIEVAIIDSGLDENHLDFTERVVSRACFSSDCTESIYDQHGHGTNVTGILAGAGTIAPQGGAPNTQLHILKVLDANNSFDSSSQVVAALDHIITELPNVSIVNMSIGTSALFTSSCDDSRSWTKPLADAINQLHARGVTLFASAGNDGNKEAITAPACLQNVIAVGATWDSRISSYTGFCTEPSPIAGELTCFSNSSDNVDIVAPGATITATGINSGISHYSGTSMAAPFVASCAALLQQAKPSLTPLELRKTLVENGGAMVTDSEGRSLPSLDCWQAYQSLNIEETPILTRLSPSSPYTTTEHSVNFSVTAKDNEDGDVSDQVIWLVNEVESDVTGDNFINSFDVGDYTVTAKIVDSANNEAQVSWQLSIVNKQLYPPQLTINSPNENSQYQSDQTVTFNAIAIDVEDGDISDAIQWYVNNEWIGQNGVLNTSFAAGTHIITAAIVDTDQNETQAEITIIVNEATVIEPPSSGSSSGGGSITLGLLILLCSRLFLFKYNR
ncbi:S8 family serine peptidase [Thalassotalea atypica]|uniref:S8 family serine peptidase n=1 Tax=Thalassotalea atypica TaxID=2054316 RepID=UPI002573B739|nr:S8 family serine peptidase [Thalassotalea atypica]